MTGKAWLIAVGAAVLLGGAGCATCHHRACHLALEAGPECAVPAYSRQSVYVFLVNGVTPGGSKGLEGLRDQLAAQGFPKVYYGPLTHAGWMASEMRRLRKEEPDARFVVVGYDLGAVAATRLAADAVAEQLPVEAVVLLDPTGKGPAGGTGVRTVLVCSAAGSSSVPHTESLSVPDAGHFSLPTHPQAIGVVLGVLMDAAGKVPPPISIPETEWLYEFAPPPKGYSAPGPNDDPTWNFLLDYRPTKPGAQDVRTVGHTAPAGKP